MRFSWRIAAALLALVGVAGCGSGPVEIPVPEPDARAARACRHLYERLPRQLDGQPRRETASDSQLVAAWGSPPIIVRCGVGKPEKLRLTSKLAVVNGVQWFPEPERSPMRFTAVHREARIELLLPQEYGVPAGALVDLAAPIKKAIPAR